MDTLKIINMSMFNLCGLKEICRYNRDIFSSFNYLQHEDLLSLITKNIIENGNIYIPPYILKNKDFIRKYKQT